MNQIRYKISDGTNRLVLTEEKFTNGSKKIEWNREKSEIYLVDILEIGENNSVKMRIYLPNEQFIVGWQLNDHLSLHFGEDDLFDGRFNQQLPS